MDLEDLKEFVEQFCIYSFLEVSVVSFIDKFILNIAASILFGITLVEGTQWIMKTRNERKCRLWGIH